MQSGGEGHSMGCGTPAPRGPSATPLRRRKPKPGRTVGVHKTHDEVEAFRCAVRGLIRELVEQFGACGPRAEDAFDALEPGLSGSEARIVETDLDDWQGGGESS